MIDDLSEINFPKLLTMLSEIAEMVDADAKTPKTPFIDTLSDDDVMELTITLYEVADEYLQEHIIHMHEQNFHKKMVDDITTNMFEQWVGAGLCNDDDENDNNDYIDVREFIQNVITDYFALSKEWDSYIPLRSSSICNTNICIPTIISTISRLREIPQPAQRTNEWYEFRHQLITASSLGMIFGTDSTRNSLIYEKCKPQKAPEDSYAPTYVNTSSPMHWGQKYEPVSVMIYENEYNTTIEDFGCIQHPTCKCIGASPDGINVNQNSPNYGRMLEIKNIVNRDITGIPLKAYWIQMQVQMETCDLDTCDFLETRFKEYETADEFYAESSDIRRGVILHFINKMPTDTENTKTYSGIPRYEYMPLDVELNKKSIDKWISNTKLKLRNTHSLYEVLYWKLPEWSCVLVERNRKWFQKARPFIEDTWKTIEKERVSGYEHRAAKKRGVIKVEPDNNTNSKTIFNLPKPMGVCLVKLDESDC